MTMVEKKRFFLTIFHNLIIDITFGHLFCMLSGVMSIHLQDNEIATFPQQNTCSIGLDLLTKLFVRVICKAPKFWRTLTCQNDSIVK